MTAPLFEFRGVFKMKGALCLKIKLTCPTLLEILSEGLFKDRLRLIGSPAVGSVAVHHITDLCLMSHDQFLLK